MIDTVYEYAGYQAALAVWTAMAALGIPLLVALAGVAWRFMRVAEDGAARPLVVYLLSLIVLWWFLSPTSVTADGRANVRAPRFVVWLNAGADAFQRQSIRGVNEGFLRRPFEWERIAAMCGLARIYDPRTRTDVHAFFESCTRPALAAIDGTATRPTMENPLRDGSLPYARFHFLSPDSPRHAWPCDQARARLLELVEQDVVDGEFHKVATQAMRDYDGAAHFNLYVDQVVRNEWSGVGAADHEMAAVRAAVGRYDPMHDNQNTMRVEMEEAPGLLKRLYSVVGNVLTSLYAAYSQTVSTATESKQKYFLITTMAPEVYGLSLLLLMAFAPIAGLWALVPGKWTALFHFLKIFLSVKLWPLGWALLSSFTQRRPSIEALSLPGQPDAGTGGIFAAVAMMYFVVPVLSFMIVNTITMAVAMPFRESTPSAAGGSPVQAVGQVVSIVRGGSR